MEAIRSSQRETKHRPGLLRIFVAALRYAHDIIGMLVTGVGNADHSYRTKEKEIFDDLLGEAFRVADEGRGASEHNEIQIFWADGKAVETVLVFRKYVNVTILPELRPRKN